MNILQYRRTPELVGQSYAGDRSAWDAILAAAFAVPFENDEQASAFHKLAGGREPPRQRVRELFAICGRRSDKTHTAAGICLFLATVAAADLLDKLAPGERGLIALVACDREQAKVALSYIKGIVADSPVLSAAVDREHADGLDFNNRVSVSVMTNNHRTLRGRTLLAVVLDEVAHFNNSADTASPDVETYRAALPGLATTGGMLIGISSPYAKRGLLYDKFRKHYGQDGDVLVVKGSTLDFNTALDPKIIFEALEDDPAAARAEWMAEWRDDVESFVPREVVDSCTVHGRYELPPIHQNRYRAHVDPSGGSSDSMTLAIAHDEGGTVVIDALREVKPPFSPEQVVEDFCALLKQYRITRVTGDRYGGEWCREPFRKIGVSYDLADKPASDLYRDLLPLLMSGRIELLDNGRANGQLCNLERRTSRSGKDSISHAPSAHDDIANVIAGVASTRVTVYDYSQLI